MRQFLIKRGISEQVVNITSAGKSQPLSNGCYEVKSGAEQQACLQVDRRVGVEITGLKRS